MAHMDHNAGVNELSSEAQSSLAEFVIFRVDVRDGWRRELVAESQLELEACNCASLMAACELYPEEQIFYEVRLSSTGELLFATAAEEAGGLLFCA